MQNSEGVGVTASSRKPGNRITLFALVLLFFSLLSSASADFVCTDCHGPEGPHTPSCSSSCNACHGNPPVSFSTGGPNGLVGPFGGQLLPSATGSISPGAHQKHAVTAGIACSTCHYNGMPATPLMGNNKIQIGFNILGAGGGTYNGTILNAPYSFEGTNGTSVTALGTRTCSSVYCHSDGTSVSTSVVPGTSSPSWNSSSPGCTTCHGFPPSYAQDNPKSNSHMSSYHNRPCNFCHYGTTTDGVTITNPSKHADGVYDVQPDTSALYNGRPVGFSYRFDIGGGRCSTISCHGGDGRTWGDVDISALILYSIGEQCYEVIFDRINFSANATPPFTYTWDFGDGTTGTGFPVTHVYARGGTYFPILTGRDARRHPYAGRSTTGVRPQWKNINVSPLADSSFSVSGYTVTLNDLSTDPDFNLCDHSGNGTISVNWSDSLESRSVALSTSPSNSVFTKTYTTAGTKTVTQTVTDNAGGQAIKTTNVTVPSAPVADFSASPLSGTAPLFVSFTDLSTSAPASWSWSFGDNETGAGQNPSHTYRAAGTYTVTLTAQNPGGSDPEEKIGYVTVSACGQQPVQIAGTLPVPYAAIRAAYDAASDGDTIAAHAVDFTEGPGLDLNREILITLKGGYNCDFTLNPSDSIINGYLIVSAGSVTVENITIL